MKIWGAFPLLALVGCTGVDGEQYMGRPGSPAWFATASPNTIASHFAQNCTAYGFKVGTPEMAQCIQQEASGKRQTNAQRAATFAQINAANQAQIAANRPKQTTCTGFGNTLNCTTY